MVVFFGYLLIQNSLCCPVYAVNEIVRTHITHAALHHSDVTAVKLAWLAAALLRFDISILFMCAVGWRNKNRRQWPAAQESGVWWRVTPECLQSW